VFDQVRSWLLRILRVPPEPEPPFGEPSSVRVFRASRKLYYLRLLGWGTAQAAALAGIIFWFGVVVAAEREAHQAHDEAAAQGRRTPELKPGRNRSLLQGFRDVSARVPDSLFLLLWVGKGIGLVVYLGQLAITYATVRLDYEMRWYVVTDRSLRIRSGLWMVKEITMSFANLQQVVVSQGPLQRLLKIADLRVQSAGGGGGKESEQGHGDSMHSGFFRGVENAGEIRDLILERLRHFREAGLGDPDEIRRGALCVGPAGDGETIAAARELLAEARRLRERLDR
jgi:hypothetical protein